MPCYSDEPQPTFYTATTHFYKAETEENKYCKKQLSNTLPYLVTNELVPDRSALLSHETRHLAWQLSVWPDVRRMPLSLLHYNTRQFIIEQYHHIVVTNEKQILMINQIFRCTDWMKFYQFCRSINMIFMIYELNCSNCNSSVAEATESHLNDPGFDSHWDTKK